VFGLPDQGPVLLVFGGSLGARVLNEVTVGAFGEAGPAVLHLCGTRDYDELRPRVLRPDYRLFAFTEDFGAALGASDLVLARAGGSVWELAAAGKPAILVPGEFATADHQTKNARYFADGGGAVVVPESEIARVPQLAAALLDDRALLDEMGAAMLRLARPRAADDIAEELIALAA
jgi:UDP-N-acetylglucosamine--N-acetylmuramyl-(pentapeptide) pyrophosphoryl-undecaprenol N-acetylglucosamine transferase